MLPRTHPRRHHDNMAISDEALAAGIVRPERDGMAARAITTGTGLSLDPSPPATPTPSPKDKTPRNL